MSQLRVVCDEFRPRITMGSLQYDREHDWGNFDVWVPQNFFSRGDKIKHSWWKFGVPTWVLERCARQDTWEALVMVPRGSLKLGKKQLGWPHKHTTLHKKTMWAPCTVSMHQKLVPKHHQFITSNKNLNLASKPPQNTKILISMLMTLLGYCTDYLRALLFGVTQGNDVFINESSVGRSDARSG